MCDGVDLPAVVAREHLREGAREPGGERVHLEERPDEPSTPLAATDHRLHGQGIGGDVLAAVPHPERVQHGTPALRFEDNGAAYLFFVRFFQVMKALSVVGGCGGGGGGGGVARGTRRWTSSPGRRRRRRRLASATPQVGRRAVRPQVASGQPGVDDLERWRRGCEAGDRRRHQELQDEEDGENGLLLRRRRRRRRLQVLLLLLPGVVR